VHLINRHLEQRTAGRKNLFEPRAIEANLLPIADKGEPMRAPFRARDWRGMTQPKIAPPRLIRRI